MGYLSLRAIRYSDVSESEQSRTHDIIIMEGWCPDDYD